jgi:hypothetical protein
MTKPSKSKQRLGNAPPTKGPEQEELDKRSPAPDDASARAKSTGHKKVTADKWNQ